MLFNSYPFVFLFLPITLAGFFLLGRSRSHLAALTWLVLASLFFYGWWNPSYLLLLGASILGNYALGLLMATDAERSRKRPWLLGVAIAFNLGLLGYFKYTRFVLDNANTLLGAHWSLGPIVLPLAISFFTFQQITYVVDAYDGKTREGSFLHYCLFVTFFPQLIAGPIVNHRQILPQFAKEGVFRPQMENLAVGMTIFAIGMVKKTVIAEGVAPYANPVFGAAYDGTIPSLLDAWVGAVAFIFQVYYDFSGYSDMAIGMARMFGIVLPLNFNAPLKAASVIELWQGWHITLTRFLRDYLYRPLGGKSEGTLRRHTNMMITMVLCGLWHGPAWTFVVFGALNGVFLAVNYTWRDWLKPYGWRTFSRGRGYRAVGLLLTFTAFTLSGVFFRAQSFGAALRMCGGMIGLGGVTVPARYQDAAPALYHWLGELGLQAARGDWLFGWHDTLLYLAVVFGITWWAPTTQEIMRHWNPYFGAPDGDKVRTAVPAWLTWRPRLRVAVLFSILLTVGLFYIERSTQFLYFQF